MRLEITEHGRKRVASDDFAKMMVHVVAEAGSRKDGFTLMATYVAMNLVVDKHNRFDLPAGKEAGAVLHDFMVENDRTIRDTINKVTQSAPFMLHAVETFGLDAVLAHA